MVIYKRKISSTKSYDDILDILRSCCYWDSFRMVDQTCFLKCPRRSTNRGHIRLFPVEASLERCGNQTEITLGLGAGAEIYIGLLIALFEIIIFILGLILSGNGKQVHGFGAIGIGIVISAFYWLRGIEVIDLLEHKLTR